MGDAEDGADWPHSLHDPGSAFDAVRKPTTWRHRGVIDRMMGARAVRRPIRPAVRVFGLVVLPTGVIWAAFGVLIQDSSLAALGLVGVGFATWLLLEHRSAERRSDAQIAIRVAYATNIAGLLAATAEPVIGLGLAVGALVPAIMALAYVDRPAMRRLMGVGISTGTYSAMASLLLPWGSNFGFALNVILTLTTFATAYAVYHVFLWNASGQLTDTAAELGEIIELSREIALTLDPQQVGRIIAEHIARAAGAQESALSTWDRANNRLVTFAYYPPERAELLDATYDLALFPATHQVLMDGKPLRVETNDPGGDTAELAYLRAIGQKSMVILPLVARGESIGIVELTSDQPGAVTDQGAAFAEQLLREAAISLENARLYDEIHHQAFRDSLTGLANRMLFHDRVSHALDRLRGRSPNQVAVLFLDLDHFKLLNDRYGHSRADDVLRAVADRVRGAIRPGDTAARLGGDEFAILLADVTGPETALAVAERVLEGLAEDIEVGDGSTRVGASIGIALSSSNRDTVDDLLRNADIAMYAGKALGRGRVELFRPELLERAALRGQLGSLLRGAVDRDEFSLAFQPIVDLGSRGRHVVGLEALVRWQPSGHPVLMPTDFVAIAEETGDIVTIGNWVIREACVRTREFQLAHDRPDLRINVNLSSRQFEDPSVVQVVADALEFERTRSGMPHDRDHREHDHDPDGGHARGCPRPQGPRRAPLDRRFRNWVLVAQLPPGVRGGRAQDRSIVRFEYHRDRQPARPEPRDRRAGSRPRPRNGRRGRRDKVPGRLVRITRLSIRPGFPVRSADGSGRRERLLRGPRPGAGLGRGSHTTAVERAASAHLDPWR